MPCLHEDPIHLQSPDLKLQMNEAHRNVEQQAFHSVFSFAVLLVHKIYKYYLKDQISFSFLLEQGNSQHVVLSTYDPHMIRSPLG